MNYNFSVALTLTPSQKDVSDADQSDTNIDQSTHYTNIDQSTHFNISFLYLRHQVGAQ